MPIPSPQSSPASGREGNRFAARVQSNAPMPSGARDSRRRDSASWPLARHLALHGPQRTCAGSLALTSPGNIAGSGAPSPNLELDDNDAGTLPRVFSKVLHGGKKKTRDEMHAALESSGISTAAMRVITSYGTPHCTADLFRRHQQKRTTFSLSTMSVAPTRQDTRTRAGRIALRLLQQPGPATLQDFIWWVSLSAGEARGGSIDQIPSAARDAEQAAYWDAIGHRIPKEHAMPIALPGFDEYLLGYKTAARCLTRHTGESLSRRPTACSLPPSSSMVAWSVRGTHHQENLLARSVQRHLPR